MIQSIDAVLAYFFCGGPTSEQMTVAGFDFEGDPLAMYCPVWFMAVSLIFGIVVAVFIYFVVVTRNTFMKYVMGKSEGWVRDCSSLLY